MFTQLRRVSNMTDIMSKIFTKQEKHFCLAFTLAEVLIILGIIGVVAALTIPTLLTKCQKVIAKSKIKKTYAILSQTTRMAEDDYGHVSTWSLPEGESWPIAKNFTDTYILPYLRVNYTCKQNNKEKNCDYKMYGLNGNQYKNI